MCYGHCLQVLYIRKISSNINWVGQVCRVVKADNGNYSLSSSLISGENGDPPNWGPQIPNLIGNRRPGSQLNIILGTPGSPFSQENGDPCVNKGTPMQNFHCCMLVKYCGISINNYICYTIKLVVRTGP